MSKSLVKVFKERKVVKDQMRELRELYMIFSQSFREQELSAYVQKKLNEAGIEFDTMGDQIYSLKEGKPIFCAHMDQVSDKPLTKVKYKKGKIKGDGNLGADDKNGVWIILQLLRKYSNDMSFLFTIGEETVLRGGILDILAKHGTYITENIPYGIVFDRRGKGDIIGEQNDYCTEEFEDDLHAVIGEFGYKPSMGVFSDADALSEYISCVNLSCGYYSAHSSKEYTVVSELYNALAAGEAIVKELKGFYKKPDKPTYSMRTRFSRDSTGWDDEMWNVWFCPVCEDIYVEEFMMDEFDSDGDLVCTKCYSKLKYYGECFESELERLVDGTIPGLEPYKDDYSFCPICGWLTYEVGPIVCEDCGTSLLKYKDDKGYVDFHDRALNEM